MTLKILNALNHNKLFPSNVLLIKVVTSPKKTSQNIFQQIASFDFSTLVVCTYLLINCQMPLSYYVTTWKTWLKNYNGIGEENSKIFVKHVHTGQKDANLRSSNDPDFAPWQYLGRLASLYEGEVSCWQNNYIFRWPASGPCVWNFYCCFSVIFFSDGALAVKLFLTDTIIMLT